MNRDTAHKLNVIGIFLVIFGSIGLIQNLRFLMTFRKINKMSSDKPSAKTVINEHFLGLFAFSLGIFALGIYLIQR